jgi:sterol desaturase/sphingolipid hydroxylase (fatty acid hydroxylase superfamily)
MLQEITDYFSTIPSLHRALILAGGITLFWLVEYAVPLFKFKYNKFRHALPNLFFTATTIVVNFSFAFLIVLTSDFVVSQKVGLLQWIEMPLWLQIIVGLMVLDLIGAWLAHFVQHKTKWMWKFHMVHHADTYVDTTTANRHHPVESVFRVAFTLLAVLVCGAPMWLVFLYQSMSVVLSQFNHANMRVPIWLDTAISWVIVSPNMHKVHHHYKLPQTDTNYGNIFSIWDRLFQTYMYTPAKDLNYGLDILDNSRDHDLGYQLKVPFDKNIKSAADEGFVPNIPMK